MLARNTANRFAFIGAMALSLSACFVGGGSKSTGLPVAKKIGDTTDLIGGPNAEGRLGDFLLRNDRIRVIIQNRLVTPRPGVQGYGGNIIDADILRFRGEAGHDRFEGLAPLVSPYRTLRARKVMVLDDGSATGEAVIRVEGEDAPYLGFSLAQAAAARGHVITANRDTSLGLESKTDYILRPGANYVEIRTTLRNRSSRDVFLLTGDVLSLGSTAPFLSESYGFALPTTDTPAVTVLGESDRVSYGYTVGRKVFVAKRRWVSALVQAMLVTPIDSALALTHDVASLGAALDDAATSQRLIVPAGGSSTFTRYFIVGNGDSGDIFAAVNAINGVKPALVAGSVTTTTLAAGRAVGSAPVADADVAFLRDGFPIAHLRTDADGKFEGELPPGSYAMAINAVGHPYPGTATRPPLITVRVREGRTVEIPTQWLPPSGRLRVFLRDMSAKRDPKTQAPSLPIEPVDLPTAGRVWIDHLGVDPSPSVMIVESIVTYPFRPASAESRVLTVGPDGEAALALEPGTYRLRAYHGPFYSTATVDAEVTAGRTTDRVLEIARVVPAWSTVIAQFNASTARGRGAKLPETVVLDALGNGIGVLVASDVASRTDLAQAVRMLDGQFSTVGKDAVSSRIGVAGGERVATGYGSFAAWPVTNPTTDNHLTSPFDENGKAHLPATILERLLAALSPRAKSEMEAERVTAQPLLQIDRPFGSPKAIGDLGLFDAADVTVRWREGSIVAGERRVDGSLLGLPSGDLLSGVRFDALNVWYSLDPTTTVLSLNAWFALLNLGYNNPEFNKGALPILVATGAGALTEAPEWPVGLPANYILEASVASPAAFLEKPFAAVGKLNDDLRSKHNLVSNGPWVEFTLNPANAPAEKKGLGGRVTAANVTGATLHVKVYTPCWAPVSQVDFYWNTPVTAPQMLGGAMLNPPQPNLSVPITMNMLDGRSLTLDTTACRPDGTGFGLYSGAVTVTTATIARDAWFVTVVHGSDFVPPLTSPFGSVRPLAITNPIFYDADGDSKFTAPCAKDVGVCVNPQEATRLGWR